LTLVATSRANARALSLQAGPSGVKECELRSRYLDTG